jgi:4-hydroxy-3-polyprenylbenzoate decarboxylase
MIANGIGDNLLTRAADVMIKEGRPLVIVPRETPLSQMHLANMLRLAQAGVKILPACPGFYHRPQTIEQLIDMIAGKICDSLQIKHDLYPRWQGI